jgi:hypothetical protein
MKILVCGDSWSEPWGVTPTKAWHCYLGNEIVNVARSGSTNEQICNQFLKNYNNSFDLIIIGWSGATRFTRSVPYNNHWQHEFSNVDKSTVDFFKDKSLNDILLDWETKIEKVISHTTTLIIQFSVFGDTPLKQYDNFLKESFLEFLANKQGIRFKYQIPIYEFDWLCERNYKFINRFGKKYFPKDWKKAIVERDVVRPGEYFLPCGHPNLKGHKAWGEFIKEFVNNVLYK